MEVLGHSQMRTTTDTYSHVMPTLGRDAADRMGNALWDHLAPMCTSGHHAGTRKTEDRFPRREAAWSNGWS